MKIKHLLLLLLFVAFNVQLKAHNTLDNVGLTSAAPASVAYSLRQLSTTYIGPLVRIKVSTSFYDVYPEVSTKKFSLSSKISAAVSTYNASVAVASANALSTIITSGITNATVAIWYDQSGNGVNVLSSSATAKIITDGSILTMNGQPTINFHNSTSYLTSSSNVNYSSQSWATVNSVAQNVACVDAVSGIISVGGLGDAAGFSWGLNFDPGTWLSGYWVDGSGTNGALSSVNSTDPKVVTALIQQDAFSSIYVNSTLKGTKSTNDHRFDPSDVVFVGARGTYTGRYFIGNIAETMIFPKSLSSTEQAALESRQSIFLPQPPGVTITSSDSGAVCAGTNVTFTANAQNFSTPPTYQWYKNGVAISGATTSTYSTTTLSNNDQINVTCSTASIIVNDSTLALWLDAGNSSSYSSGTTWTNLGNGGATFNATLNSHQTFSSNNGGHFQFDGTPNPILLNKVTSAITEVTMSAWVYITPGTTQGSIMKNGAGLGYTFGAGGGGGFCPGTYPGMLLAGQGWLGSNSPTSNFSSGWQLCTMVITGTSPTTYKYYINGTLANTATFSSPSAPNGSYTALGDNYGDGGGCTPFNSKMAAAYFYTKALSQSEITQNYDALAARFGLNSTNSISSNTITTTISAPQVSITSSASGAVCSGTTITFTATVCGIPTPTYQWYKNGAIIPGANSSTYSTTSLANNDQINVWVNGGINNSNIVSNGLKLNLDASNPGSYSGTGNTWYDLSGNNNHGTLMNSPTYDAASGSIVTNGTNQYISIPQISSANTNITMQAWVYVNLNTTGTFIKSGTGGGGYSIGIGNWAYDQVGSNVVMLLYGRGWIGSGVSYGTAGWKLVTLTLDGSSTARAYVNGSLIGTYTWPTPTTPSGPLNLGANIGDGNIYYNGKFAAAYFYNRELSLAEITQNYNAFATKTTAYNSNTITISVTGSVPTVTVVGDSCANKTTLSTTSGLTAYAWYKDNVAVSGATSNTYVPSTAGDYKVVVSNGSCTTASTSTTISNCGLTSDGKMLPTTSANSLVSNEGGTNFGTALNNLGAQLNTTGLTTTTGTIGATSAVLGGVISSTNGVSSSVGVIYSTDANFGTYSTSIIQSNAAAGTYTGTITGLTSLTNYYVKSFVVNSAGTSYGPVVSFTTASPPPPAAGDNYGGGKIFYIFQPGDSGYVAGETHGLIAATSDTQGYRVFGCRGWPSGTSTTLGTGTANTTTLLGCSETNFAAKLARAVRDGGYTDWSLPSKDELNKLYLNRNSVGNFIDVNYWSSSESNAWYAWYQSFSDGSQNQDDKNAQKGIRAIRTF